MNLTKYAKPVFAVCLTAGLFFAIVSRFVIGIGFLMLIISLLCFLASFCAVLFMLYRRPAVKRLVKAVRIVTFFLILVGLVSFIVIECLIVSGWQKGEPQPADCLIVLGAGLHGSQMSQVLYSRMKLAAEYLEAYPDCTVIVSGGQGPDEDISESAAMKSYLLGRGIAESRIIEESRSSSTYENLLYSKQIIESQSLGGRIAVLSNSFHLFRAKKIAGGMGLDVQTLGAPIPRVFLTPLNSYVREYFSIVNMYLLGQAG